MSFVLGLAYYLAEYELRRTTMVHENARVLRRSRTDWMVAGVCGGLGEFFGINPLWFRLGFLIALIPGGVPGLAVYVLFWIIIPKERRS